MKTKLMLPVIIGIPTKRVSDALKPIERTWIDEVRNVLFLTGLDWVKLVKEQFHMITMQSEVMNNG